MMRILTLLLPVLIPSWRFFAMIAPSPRIEIALLSDGEETSEDWLEFRPRPAHLPVLVMTGRLLWNPRWNETLFLVTCTERFLGQGREDALNEILGRIAHDLRRAEDVPIEARAFLMRLVAVHREGGTLHREEVYRSPAQPLRGEASS